MLQSLSGHQSPVECVTFDNAEEVVVAGAAGGTIKLGDLEEAKGVHACNPQHHDVRAPKGGTAALHCMAIKVAEGGHSLLQSADCRCGS